MTIERPGVAILSDQVLDAGDAQRTGRALERSELFMRLPARVHRLRRCRRGGTVAPWPMRSIT